MTAAQHPLHLHWTCNPTVYHRVRLHGQTGDNRGVTSGQQPSSFPPPSNLVTPLPSLSASACVSLGFLFSLLYACRAVFSSSRPPAHSFPVAFFFIFKKVGGGGWAGKKKERPLNFKNWKPKIVFIYFNIIKSRQGDEGDFFFFALQLLVFFKWNKSEINNPDALIDK